MECCFVNCVSLRLFLYTAVDSKPIVFVPTFNLGKTSFRQPS